MRRRTVLAAAVVAPGLRRPGPRFWWETGKTGLLDHRVSLRAKVNGVLYGMSFDYSDELLEDAEDGPGAVRRGVARLPRMVIKAIMKREVPEFWELDVIPDNGGVCARYDALKAELFALVPPAPVLA